mmetsp:Transcript_66054/g.193706  ORF Transcript_66054/g.193706 Transcript_66054/m.193706 type:complete len:248 (+) Transcript_66054:76-819(+)
MEAMNSSQTIPTPRKHQRMATKYSTARKRSSQSSSISPPCGSMNVPSPHRRQHSTQFWTSGHSGSSYIECCQLSKAEPPTNTRRTPNAASAAFRDSRRSSTSLSSGTPGTSEIILRLRSIFEMPTLPLPLGEDARGPSFLSSSDHPCASLSGSCAVRASRIGTRLQNLLSAPVALSACSMGRGMAMPMVSFSLGFTSSSTPSSNASTREDGEAGSGSTAASYVLPAGWHGKLEQQPSMPFIAIRPRG